MNNQDDKNMVKTKIEGTDFIYNSEINYEKEGHIYCKYNKSYTLNTWWFRYRKKYRVCLRADLKSKPTIITTNLNFKDIETEQEDIMLGRIETNRFISKIIAWKLYLNLLYLF